MRASQRLSNLPRVAVWVAFGRFRAPIDPFPVASDSLLALEQRLAERLLDFERLELARRSAKCPAVRSAYNAMH